MTIAAIVALFFGSLIAVVAAIYCFRPDMIVRQTTQTPPRAPVLLHFALPIRPRDERLTVRRVRSTGLGLFLLSAWFLLVAVLSIIPSR
jgi:hypothetical protein